MAFEAKEFDLIAFQQPRIGRTVRRMTSLTPFDLHRRMFINKRPGFIGVTFHTPDFAALPAAKLFGLEAAVLIVTIGTLHAAFRNFVMERTRKRSLLVGVTFIAAFRLRIFE